MGSQLELPTMNKLKEITETAIGRLKAYEPSEGYYLAFSGGKDSQTIYHLAKEAGVKFDAHFNFTTVDPPEVVKFIKENYPDVEIHYPHKSMFHYVLEKGLPTRPHRWCCEIFKERGGDDRLTITGVRWSESIRRKNTRKVYEICYKTGNKVINPIVDWETDDIWNYLGDTPHCSLYDEGFKRIGCVLCPMTSARRSQLELSRFPKLGNTWKQTCYKLYASQKFHTNDNWTSAEEMWQWWLSRKGDRKNKAQYTMFD